MYTISKTFTFEASHVLSGLPPDHKCGRLHGHSYEVELVLSAPRLDDVGFVLDFAALDGFGAWLKFTCDHRHLNDVFIPNPTSELLAKWFYAEAANFLVVGPPVGRTLYLVCARVSETPHTWAEFRPGEQP